MMHVVISAYGKIDVYMRRIESGWGVQSYLSKVF
jgi:hypothetical protein